jgi:hypothetical protein
MIATLTQLLSSNQQLVEILHTTFYGMIEYGVPER